MKLTGYNGEYKRVLRSIRKLSKPHYFSDGLKASKLSNRIIRLKHIKLALEKVFSDKKLALNSPCIQTKCIQQKSA